MIVNTTVHHKITHLRGDPLFNSAVIQLSTDQSHRIDKALLVHLASNLKLEIKKSSRTREKFL